MTGLLSDAATTTLFRLIMNGTILIAAGFIFKLALNAQVELARKTDELRRSEVVRRRAEIASEFYVQLKRFCGGGARVEDICDPSLEARVACWFPDDVYRDYRDFLAKLTVNPSLHGTAWADFEPLVQSIISAVRPESRILRDTPCKLGGSNFHFLPPVRFEQSPKSLDNGD